MEKKKISIALSGGIDSTLAGLIIKKSGIYIETMFMQNWKHENENICKIKKEITYIKNIIKNTKIKIHFINMIDEYWTKIFIPFIKNLTKGYTPNPDISCNKIIKFNIFMTYVKMTKNFDYLATGHYSKIQKKNKKYKLAICFDKNKDQTYFLYAIKKKYLKNILFPLANYSKKKVKKIIKDEHLINFNKKESMGICFIGEKNIKSFISKYLKKNTGDIISEKKEKIGSHDGVFLYTLGEKKYINNELNFIYRKNTKKNTLYVTTCIKNLITKTINLKRKNKQEKTYFCQVKIRHQKNTIACLIKKTYTNTSLIFKNLNELFVPGQHIVVYKNKICEEGYKLNL